MSQPFPFVSEEKLAISELLTAAHHARAGAVVLFSGEVRNHQEGKDVDFLEYEAHLDLARNNMSAIVEDAKKKWPLHIVFVQHRIGKVGISESAVVVVTASSHRVDAYEANQYIIDRIKSETPIWKKEFFTSGEIKWQ